MAETFGKWKAYHEQTEKRLPRESLVQAVQLVSEKEFALDLGAGTLNDSKYLLEVGFQHVLAVDGEPSVSQNVDAIDDKKLEIIISTFESFEFPIARFDLINAQYSLPFTSPESFHTVFEKMKNSLKTNGIFVGQLFGKNDGWANRPNMTFHTLGEAQELLSGIEIIELREEERVGNTAAGNPKHWHIFQIIARKK